MGKVFFFDWEIKLMELFQSVEAPLINILAIFFTMLGEEYLMILILGVAYWSYNKDVGRAVAVAVTGTMMGGALIKGVAIRRRPYMDNGSIKCIRAAQPGKDIMNPSLQGYSLPSLHSSMSMGTYGTLARKIGTRLFKIIAIALPFLIGLSRIYLGVHYPTDVIPGWIVGFIVMFFLGMLTDKKGYKASFAVILAVGFIGFFYCQDIEFFSCYGIGIGVLAAFVFEEKYVNFENTRKPLAIILRPVIGVVLFVIISSILKLPAKYLIPEDWLYPQLYYRLFRYIVTSFVITGPYTILFKKISFLK